ncbi:UNVERIFIED_CONTAM: hypothetical protein FKN15_035881 [Acipenser sinensis]
MGNDGAFSNPKDQGMKHRHLFSLSPRLAQTPILLESQVSTDTYSPRVPEEIKGNILPSFLSMTVIETQAAMLTLASKLKRDDAVKSGHSNSAATDSARRVSIRDRLLVKGSALQYKLPLAAHSEVAELEANLPNTCKVNFPDVNKLHHFQLDVTPDEGYYQSGKFQFEVDVPEAYNMVDLLNFDDPLNIEAAEHHLRDKIKQDTEKTTAVATVVAAVDLARVREPVAGFTERTTKETLATIHVQSIQDQAEGGKKAEAVAKVLAAVDQARIKGPVRTEEACAEDTSMEYEYKHQALSKQTIEQQIVTKPVKTEAVRVPSEIQIIAADKADKSISQIERRKETAAHTDTSLSTTPVPHFTVAKVTVPKPEHNYEVSIAGCAIATLQKELAATAAQKITRPVKPPIHKTVETRMMTEQVISPMPPFKETSETYQMHYDTHLHKEIGTSYLGAAEKEDKYQIFEEWDKETVKAPPELSKRVSTIRSTTTHHPTVSAPSTCTSALNQDW